MSLKIGRIRVKTASGLELIHPEIKVESIKKDSVTAMSTSAANLAKAAGDGILRIRGDASVDGVSDVYEVGAAPASHPHLISDVTNLEDTLANKVPIVGGLIPNIHFPEYLRGRVRYSGVYNLAGGTVSLSTIFSGSLDYTDLGKYYVIGTAGTVSVGNGFSIIGGHEGGTDYSLESKEILMLANDAGSGNWEVLIINRTTKPATTARKGTMSIGSTVSTRFALSSNTTDRHLRMITEAELRSVLKQIDNCETAFWNTSVNITVNRVYIFPSGGPNHTSGSQNYSMLNGISPAWVAGEYMIANNKIYSVTTNTTMMGEPTDYTNVPLTYLGALNAPAPGFINGMMYYIPDHNKSIKFVTGTTVHNFVEHEMVNNDVLIEWSNIV